MKEIICCLYLVVGIPFVVVFAGVEGVVMAVFVVPFVAAAVYRIVTGQPLVEMDFSYDPEDGYTP